jgi:hypothetical protein
MQTTPHAFDMHETIQDEGIWELRRKYLGKEGETDDQMIESAVQM